MKCSVWNINEVNCVDDINATGCINLTMHNVCNNFSINMCARQAKGKNEIS